MTKNPDLTKKNKEHKTPIEMTKDQIVINIIKGEEKIGGGSALVGCARESLIKKLGI